MTDTKTMAFPFAIVNGRVAVTTNATDQLTNRVFSVLATQPGERVMRPNYGCDMGQFDFDIGDELEQAEMLDEAQRAVLTWEPGAVLRDVSFAGPVDANGNLTVNITYVPAGSGDNSAVVTQQVTLGILNAGGVTDLGAGDSLSALGGSTSPAVSVPQSRTFGTLE